MPLSSINIKCKSATGTETLGRAIAFYPPTEHGVYITKSPFFDAGTSMAIENRDDADKQKPVELTLELDGIIPSGWEKSITIAKNTAALLEDMITQQNTKDLLEVLKKFTYTFSKPHQTHFRCDVLRAVSDALHFLGLETPEAFAIYFMQNSSAFNFGDLELIMSNMEMALNPITSGGNMHSIKLPPSLDTQATANEKMDNNVHKDLFKFPINTMNFPYRNNTLSYHTSQVMFGDNAVHGNQANQIKHLPTPAELKLALASTMGYIPRLCKRASTPAVQVVLAGGCLARAVGIAMKGNGITFQTYPNTDWDFFMVSKRAKENDLYDCVINFLTVLQQELDDRGWKIMNVFITQNAITVSARPTFNDVVPPCKYQIVLSAYKSWHSLLGGFDLDPCRIASSSDACFYATKSAIAAFQRNSFSLTTLENTPETIKRAEKYVAMKRFNCIDPFACMQQNYANSTYTQGTQDEFETDKHIPQTYFEYSHADEDECDMAWGALSTFFEESGFTPRASPEKAMENLQNWFRDQNTKFKDVYQAHKSYQKNAVEAKLIYEGVIASSPKDDGSNWAQVLRKALHDNLYTDLTISWDAGDGPMELTLAKAKQGYYLTKYSPPEPTTNTNTFLPVRFADVPKRVEKQVIQAMHIYKQ